MIRFKVNILAYKKKQNWCDGDDWVEISVKKKREK